MHRNAQRAMVGVGIYRMNVRHLNNGKKREQNQAHQSRNRQSSKLCAPMPARGCLKSCQYQSLL
jgi:hypothetical protein